MSQNLYRGINAHLNSLLQTPGTDDQPSIWGAFHAAHLNHIADLLNLQLPEHYTAYTEQSLQVRGIDWGEDTRYTRPRPDVSIFSQPSVVAPVREITASYAAAPTWQGAIADVIVPIKHPIAVVIRKRDVQANLGKVVTRIELLSPSNKPGGSDYTAYEDRRIEALESGSALIELDYLHESPSLLQNFPRYPHEHGAFPYTIAISTPRPDWQQGQIQVYGFRVNTPIPVVNIPLADADQLPFEFDAAYQQTFVARRFHNLLNYQAPPIRFETYSPDDQDVIRRLLNAV